MKIIFLNAWHGQIPAIKQFISDHIPTTDIFCFQESNLEHQSEIFCLDWLKDYQFFFDHKITDKDDDYTNITFIKKDFTFIETRTLGKEDNKIGLENFTKIQIPSGVINLCNVHGYTWPGDKQDTPDRLRQSQLIIDSLKELSGPKIIGGDFNLDRDIKSTRLFEENGYRNLIKDFNIPTTRNEISWQRFPQKQLFADQLFVSPDINITNFSVPNVPISDHLPMILEFEI